MSTSNTIITNRPRRLRRTETLRLNLKIAAINRQL